jgi:hypothetical protein
MNSEIKLVATYDHADGAVISRERVDKWHEEILQKFKDDPLAVRTAARSGNSMVIGIRYDDGEINIFEITKGYKVFTYHDSNP